MGAFRQQQSQQFMNQQMNMQMQMQMHMLGVMSTGWEYNFLVMMRDSTKKEIKSAIYTDTTTKKHFIVLVDKKYKKTDTNRYKKIYPSQTLNLTCVLKPKNDEDGTPGRYLPGKPTDTCWMFKAISGPISAYSYTIENDASRIDTSTIVGIQFNNGPIVKFNEDNLKQMVGQDDINALEDIAKKNYLRAIKKYNRDIEKATKK
ncbi:MAG: hypothetical protein ACHQIM_11820 [Sphingobacteriales bacterium]